MGESEHINNLQPVEARVEGMIRDRSVQQDLNAIIENTERRVAVIDRLLSRPV